MVARTRPAPVCLCCLLGPATRERLSDLARMIPGPDKGIGGKRQQMLTTLPVELECADDLRHVFDRNPFQLTLLDPTNGSGCHLEFVCERHTVRVTMHNSRTTDACTEVLKALFMSQLTRRL